MKILLATIVSFIALGCLPLRPENVGSVLLNNGDETPRSAYPHVVIVNGNCTGTIINDIPQVLTAGHCVSVQASVSGPTATYPRNSPKPPETLTVDVMGEVFIPVANDVHPAFIRRVWEFVDRDDITKVIWIPDPERKYTLGIGGDGMYRLRDFSDPDHPVVVAEGLRGSPYLGNRDIAVLTLPPEAKDLMDQRQIKPAKLADSAPAVGEPVTVVGYGLLQQVTDLDADGIVNDSDRCPLTPQENLGEVEATGPRTGCAPTELATELPDGTPRQDDEVGTLRSGTNEVIGVEEFYAAVVIRGPLTSVSVPGQVTPGPGDSGGPLLNKSGEVVGTVMHGAIKANPGVSNRPYHVVMYADVNAKRNKGFLADASRR